eukprot:753426-Hanusia_phi.AAC.1
MTGRLELSQQALNERRTERDSDTQPLALTHRHSGPGSYPDAACTPGPLIRAPGHCCSNQHPIQKNGKHTVPYPQKQMKPP